MAGNGAGGLPLTSKRGVEAPSHSSCVDNRSHRLAVGCRRIDTCLQEKSWLGPLDCGPHTDVDVPQVLGINLVC